MFITALFWKCFGVSSIGLVVGLLATKMIVAIINSQREKSKRDDYFFIDCAISAVILLVFSAIILLLTMPISRWFEITLISFGISGFAFRWIGLELARFINLRANFSSEWPLLPIGILTPLLVINLLVGVANHYWLHVI